MSCILVTYKIGKKDTTLYFPGLHSILRKGKSETQHLLNV